MNPTIWRLTSENQFTVIKFQLLAHSEALSGAAEMSAESPIDPVCPYGVTPVPESYGAWLV